MKGFTLLLAACSAVVTSAFYLPGVAPKEYADGETVPMKVNALTSASTHLAKPYYSAKFCRPEGGPTRARENLGEHLSGDDIYDSPYTQIKMKHNLYCERPCMQPTLLSERDIAYFKKLIDNEYHVHWILDNLPAVGVLPKHTRKLYAQGFPIGGRYNDGSYFLYNHVNMTVRYHDDPASFTGSRVVGFEVTPYSVRSSSSYELNVATNTLVMKEGAAVNHCVENKGLPKDISDPMLIAGPHATGMVGVVWSYDVVWERSDVAWASRWDIYLNMDHLFGNDIHWFNLVNSFVIVIFLTGMVAMILVRALNADITRYNRVPTDEERAEDLEEKGWKLVHGDVFRGPAWPGVFSVLVGCGAQVGVAVFTTVCFAAIGFLNPARRGSLITGLLIFYVLSGVFAGYYASTTYKLLGGEKWQRVTVATATGLPGVLLGVFFIFDMVEWAAGATNAVNFWSMLLVFALWGFVYVPLVFMGAYYGFRQDKPKSPVRVANIPRPVPPQPWFLSTWFTAVVGGILPFGAVFVEIFYIFNSVWSGVGYYYVFGFLLLSLLLLFITCAEISIVMAYFTLCSEDYHWWWRSFIVPGASGVYLFAYCIVYFRFALTNMDTFTPIMLYFGYMGLISLMFTMVTGAAGYLATHAFVHRIYGAIKVD